MTAEFEGVKTIVQEESNNQIDSC